MKNRNTITVLLVEELREKAKEFNSHGVRETAIVFESAAVDLEQSNEMLNDKISPFFIAEWKNAVTEAIDLLQPYELD